jgi:hypothetical protein
MDMDHEIINTAAGLIARDFELSPFAPEAISEAELLRVLSDHIADMIERELEALLSTLYRMDIDEGKVHFALSPFCEEPANIALARLVLEREKQRAFTKKHYKQSDLGDLDGLDW